MEIKMKEDSIKDISDKYHKLEKLKIELKKILDDMEKMIKRLKGVKLMADVEFSSSGCGLETVRESQSNMVTIIENIQNGKRQKQEHIIELVQLNE